MIEHEQRHDNHSDLYSTGSCKVDRWKNILGEKFRKVVLCQNKEVRE